MADEAQPAQTRALLDDLASAEYDVLSLARRHGLSLDALIAWADRPETRRALSGLCVLADAQAQLLLSRYRLAAATRLIAQVTAEADALPAEQVRKACVDLLKIELSRATDLSLAGEADEDAEFEALRAAMSPDADGFDPDTDGHTDDEPGRTDS
ncbi:MAG: hypothetical protein ACE37H_03080 [Phycisphaeraceae bacterium]